MEAKESRYFRGLYRVAVTINSSLDPLQVLRAIAESIASAMSTKACSIMLLTPDRRVLRHSISYGLSERYVQKGPVSVDLSMSEALSGRSVAVLDAGTDPRCQYGPQAIEEGIASILSIPIRLRDEVIGVMRVYTGEPREFSEDDVEFVEAAGNLGAIALENARSHEEVKNHFDMVSRYVYGDTWVGQLWSTSTPA